VAFGVAHDDNVTRHGGMGSQDLHCRIFSKKNVNFKKSNEQLIQNSVSPLNIPALDRSWLVVFA
jgi:hypothetical protein